jgi:type IV pilus assembly protein PilY1
MKTAIVNRLISVVGMTALGCFLAMAPWTVAYGQALADYTAYPLFVSKTVPPNILFIVDLSEAMLPAAYGSYPESSGGKISSNLTGVLTATGLCGTNATPNTNGVGCPSPSGVADSFDSSQTYFGMFDSLGCYTYGSNEFGSRTSKASVNSNCATSQWDGNFLNWLSMRKVDHAKKVLIGGRTLSASNNDGTANTLLGEQKTGSDGSTASCNNSSSFCFRYVKVSSGSGNRFPNTVPVDAGNVTYFGLGEGVITVSNVATEANIFAGTSYNIKVDLTTETDAYRQAQSLGLLQNLRTDNMRVGVMFTNSSNGKAATVFRAFDGTFNSSAITGIRNQQLSSYAALAEGTYEAFCYYRNSQGPCYSNSPADFAASVGASGDPFYFVSNTQTVGCCKSFILMISSGQPTGDGSVPDVTSPFGDLFTTDTVGIATSRLDDVTFYGQTHDIRNQASGTTGYVSGAQKVTFYAVNAMGGGAGSQLLASSAKYGGFEDRDSNGVPNSTGQTCTYPAGTTLGSGSSNSSLEWDLDQNCIPDTYFDASEGGNLEATINKAIADILKRAASGTSVSVLATSSTGEGTIYQAYFFPSQFEGLNEIKWTGYTQGLFVDSLGNLREDTNADGKLVYGEDHIVKTRFDATNSEVKVDRFYDANPADGIADSTTPFESVGLKEVKAIWEAGRRLALRDLSSSPRNILTWVDTDSDGFVDAGEQIAFSSTNATTLSPYLRAEASVYTAANIISFIQGNQVSGMRDRQLTMTDDSGGSVVKVWRFGDPINSTPTVIGPPKERFDVIYGDASYTAFFQQYKNRRLVAYVGANDGMLHAFNAGYYHRGDDSSTSEVEHGYFTKAPTNNSSSISLGHELWGFIPYQLLPHLKWLTQSDYTHVYYVDLKPKVTDARIFAADADHPNGWGTILIGGFRMGGSCGGCVSNTGAPPMTVTADFGSGVQTRTFYTAYFALDITNPEVDPKLLWVFTDSAMGLSTSYPAVLRVSPSADGKSDNTNAKWFMVVGSGPTGYDGSSGQTGRLFVVDIKNGPKDSNGSNVFSTFLTSDTNSFMGDLVTLDANLDFRVDTTYVGNVINNGNNTPSWYGKMYRLTTTGCASAPCSTSTWGGTPNAPTVLLATFPSAGTTKVGPITAPAMVTADESARIWVFFGTGRFFGTNDKSNTDTQYLYGVKDPVVTGTCTQSTSTNCEKKNILNVSNAVVCVVCASGTNQVTGVTGVDNFSGTGTNTLEGLVQSMDGWYTTLPTSKERALSQPTLLGGTVFYTSFVPNADICSASGDGMIYALFYKTGSAYKESVIGTYTSGSNTNVSRSIALGIGLPSQMAVQIGGQGDGVNGQVAGGGCAGRVTGFIQASTGALNQFCGKPALSSWSRYVSWLNKRI